jgi:hypothetical protein
VLLPLLHLSASASDATCITVLSFVSAFPPAQIYVGVPQAWIRSFAFRSAVVNDRYRNNCRRRMGWRKFFKSATAPPAEAELPTHCLEKVDSARKYSFTSSNGSKSTADFDVLTTSAFELSALLSSNAITSVEIVAQYLEQIDQHNRRGRQIRALISVAPRHGLLEVARRLDEERASGEIRGPLHGVPIVLKDSIMTDASLGMDTTVGSWTQLDTHLFSHLTQSRLLRIHGMRTQEERNHRRPSRRQGHDHSGESEHD